MNAVDHHVALVGGSSESPRQPDSNMQIAAPRKGLIDGGKVTVPKCLFQDVACHGQIISRRPVVKQGSQLILVFLESCSLRKSMAALWQLTPHSDLVSVPTAT